MSAHDRGAFGQLLAEAKALGCSKLRFDADLFAADESPDRWSASACFASPDDPQGKTYRFESEERGRTGEEALRRLVEKLRG